MEVAGLPWARVEIDCIARELMLYKYLFIFLWNVILTAQVTKTDSTLIKNPKTAFYLSVVPGGAAI